jgi:hypothetical protein
MSVVGRTFVHSDVRFGSPAEVEARLRCVRSPPNSRHQSARSVRPFSAEAGSGSAEELVERLAMTITQFTSGVLFRAFPVEIQSSP